MTADTYFTRREGGEYAYTIEASKLKFGLGAIHEVGADAKALGMTRVALYTDARVAKLEHVAHAANSLRGAGLDIEIYDAVEVEPTDRSFMAGAQFARGKRAERIEICQHQRWLVEGADEVLARRSVDRGLAPD